MTEDVLDTIDHALRDWETSPDAMRWTPDTDAHPAPAETTAAAFEALARAFNDFMRTLLEVVQRDIAPMLRRLAHVMSPRRSDPSQPRPLCIDGHEYARRRRARRRRR